jgi:hypothetical protein
LHPSPVIPPDLLPWISGLLSQAHNYTDHYSRYSAILHPFAYFDPQSGPKTWSVVLLVEFLKLVVDLHDQYRATQKEVKRTTQKNTRVNFDDTRLFLPVQTVDSASHSNTTLSPYLHTNRRDHSLPVISPHLSCSISSLLRVYQQRRKPSPISTKAVAYKTILPL